jgi:ATP-dependent Lhr-like helicase
VLEEAITIDPLQRRFLVEDSVRESIAFIIRFLQVAKRMGVVDPDKPVPRELARKIVSAYKGSVVERETLREIIYDKLDFNALNEFLDNIRAVHIVSRGGSPLQDEVYNNPYLRKDKAVDLKSIALKTLIESYKKRLKRKNVILLCTKCGHTWTTTAGSISPDTSCPKCGSRLIAVLPDTEWGRNVVATYKEYMRRNHKKRFKGEKAKLIKEAKERATLFLEYYREGLIPKVVEALSAFGVGPATARRILSAYVMRGEEAFYRELFKAMEEYAANRKFWKV